MIQAIKKAIYPDSKWITTGISKGGQTTIFHRYFYPEDVDISVPYVAPLNLEYVDPRIQKFLDRVGSPKGGLGRYFFGSSEGNDCNWSIHKFQELCFANIDALVPKVAEYAEDKGYTFEMAGGLKRVVQLMILEYPFAFWQWGHHCSNIPEDDDDIDVIYNNLMEVSDPSFLKISILFSNSLSFMLL